MGQVVDDRELVTLVEADRAAGRTIAFANGCFDVLHVGHVRYLRGARREADRLVVAINSDASERRLKGPGRPILDEATRAELVAAISGVDYVVIFSGDSPADLLRRLRPELHCKGTDYGKPEAVPEFAAVQEYGGRTVLVGDPKSHATSDLIGAVAKLLGRPQPGPTRSEP